jgi:glycosyltransferase involved in cell wall biosynthesis
MKIAFVWDWNPTYEQTITWMDGLSRAIKELADRGHEVSVYVPGEVANIVDHPYFPINVSPHLKEALSDVKPDVILHFADMTRPNAQPLRELNIPMAICFAGGDPVSYNTYCFDHVFVESQVYKEVFDRNDTSCSIAFGTNTELFTPLEQPKVFDTIFPATFAGWKRHDLYAEATRGLRSLAVGWMYQDHEQECWQECVRLGTTVLPHVSADALHYLYAASKICVITSHSGGGSQRTVLEAMAMNLPLIVTDSDKFDYAKGDVYHCEPEAQEIRSYINAILDGDGDVNTRDYILNNWSHVQYADSLEKELLRISS